MPLISQCVTDFSSVFFWDPVWLCFYLQDTNDYTQKVCVCVRWGWGQTEGLHVPPSGFCVYVFVCPRVCWGGDGPVCCHWATCQGPLKALCAVDSGRKAAIGPRIKTWVGGGSVEVGIKGRAVWRKIKKPSNLFVGDNCAAQQEGRYLYSSTIYPIKTAWVTFESGGLDLCLCFKFINYIFYLKKMTIKTWNNLLAVFWVRLWYY